MSNRIGVRVFPNAATDSITRSPSLIHYTPKEPPIDYTIKEKRIKGDYRLITNTFPKEPSPDYANEEDSLQSQPRLSKSIKPVEHAKKRSNPRRKTTEIILRPERPKSEVIIPRQIERRNTLTETEIVLQDLDSTLAFEESINFSDAKKKLEALPVPYRQYSPGSYPVMDMTPDSSRSTSNASSIERMKCIACQKNDVPMVPVLNENVIEDLKHISTFKDIHKVNEDRRKMVEDMYEKTRQLIADAKMTYCPEYFLYQYDTPEIPLWKRQLLAKKQSRKTIGEFEEHAWADFTEWKRRNAPGVPLKPEYEFSMKATLR